MPYCPKCGELIEETALFCSNCGAVLKRQLKTGQSAIPPLSSSKRFNESTRRFESTVPEANEPVITLHRPSLGEKIFFFMSGILMSAPFTILAETLSDNFISIDFPEMHATILSIAIISPSIEEFSKAFPLFYRHGETERTIFLLGFLSGLGFGIVEFFLYVLVYSAPILIRLPLVLFHATNTSITAYGIATKRTLQFYLIAVTLHFLINFSAISFLAEIDLISIIGMLIALLISYTLSWNLYRKTQERIMK